MKASSPYFPINSKNAALLALAILFVAGCAKKNEPAPATASQTPTVSTETVKTPGPAVPTKTAEATKTPPPAPQQSVTTSKPAEKPIVATKPTAPEDKSKPRLDYSPKPIYPASLLDLCIEGEVRVKMRVNTDGKPEDIQILESTEPAFGEALKTVLPLWRFFPAEKDGVAVVRTVNIAIPFVINNRPIDLPEKVTHGQPELVGIARPAHPGKGPASVVAKITLGSDTIVTNVEIEKSEGQIDNKALKDSISQWVFMPSNHERDNGPNTTVEAGVTFTKSGNVLIQYPYPTPQPNNR